MQNNIPTVLEKIVSRRRTHLAGIRQRIAHVDPQQLAPSQRSLYESLGGPEAAQHRAQKNRFIMECKSASPSLGKIRENYDPAAIARVYSRYASGISVLCEPEFFNGDYDHLATVAASTHLPVLCKDFIIDPVQVHAARYFGADAILLMLSVLDDAEYQQLSAEAARLGLDVLTEVIDAQEVRRALNLGAKIVGVNHRNLHDLSIDLTRSGRLVQDIPDDVVVVSESGIRDHSTVRALAPHSNAFLVGSQLTSQPDIDQAARALVFGTHKVCGLGSISAAQAAQACGAYYGGLIFEESSPRNVSRETAQEIISAVPGLNYVAVSRRETGWNDMVLDGISTLQIHTPLHHSVDEEVDFINRVREDVDPELTLWRAISMTTPQGPEIASALANHPELDGLVLDAGDGGTGQSFDWSRIPNTVLSRSLLAGGVNRHNLGEALALNPRGVDLNSGVEYHGEQDNPWRYQKNAAEIASVFSFIRHDKESQGALAQ